MRLTSHGFVSWVQMVHAGNGEFLLPWTLAEILEVHARPCLASEGFVEIEAEKQEVLEASQSEPEAVRRACKLGVFAKSRPSLL